jgi:hypothetical protein
MKMKRLLKTVTLISIVLLYSSVYAITHQQYKENHEARIEDMCEDDYECALTQLYGLNKVIDIIMYAQQMGGKTSEEGKFLDELLDRHYIADYDTFDFMSVHIDFEEYLEGDSYVFYRDN